MLGPGPVVNVRVPSIAYIKYGLPARPISTSLIDPPTPKERKKGLETLNRLPFYNGIT